MNQDILKVLPWIQNVPDLGMDAYLATMNGPISFLGMKNLSEGYAEVLENNRKLEADNKVLRDQIGGENDKRTGDTGSIVSVNNQNLSKFIDTIATSMDPDSEKKVLGVLEISINGDHSEKNFKEGIWGFLNSKS